ncbi:MAG: Stp1/IreP family PP2C-type Ser/Thr phosphatase [Gemmiger sp.]|nr:Stp1/IreP family PP2C-type Ser/Thr phosphatase [Gemmiger sp.]
MKLAAITDIGSCRQENQDNYCAQQLADGSGWGIVCDGMGGVQGGRVAARIATDTMLRYFQKELPTLCYGEEKQFIQHGFDITNHAVYDKATSDPEMLGMGTTGVCAYIKGKMAHIVHAGDSRAYLLQGGAMRQITRDHSMVQQLVDSGQITREQAAAHPQKNLITRALGVSATIVPEYNRCEVAPGDILLLCTDGLTNMVSDEEIRLILQEAPFFEAPDLLVERALKAGGQDNITVMLMGVESTESING